MIQCLFPTKNLPVINGRNVRLRPIRDEDTDLIVRWRNSPSVLQYFIFREPFTPEMHRGWLKNKVEPGFVVQYIIEDRQSGQSVGSVYFRDIDIKTRSAEYGIFIGEDSARGRGLGSETAQLFTDFGFDVLGLHRISLRLIAGNAAAQRSYEKAGFVFEGCFKDMIVIDDNFHDVIFMAKINDGDRT